MTDIPRFQKEFPNFPAEDMPEIPPGFTDESWHNDSCPCLISDGLRLQIYVDWLDVSKREIDVPGERFSIFAIEGDMNNVGHLTSTDSWTAILAVVDVTRAHVAKIASILPTADQLAVEYLNQLNIVRADVASGKEAPSGIIEKDYFDTNMIMARSLGAFIGYKNVNPQDTNQLALCNATAAILPEGSFDL